MEKTTVGQELLLSVQGQFGSILADPPWRFSNRTGKMAPEPRRLARYNTMTIQELMELPVAQFASPQSHLYLWLPNALVQEGLEVMKRWGLPRKRTWFGTKSVKTVALTVEVYGSTFGMSQN